MMDPYLENAPCLYFATNDAGILTEVNAALCRELGCDAASLTGTRIEDIFTLATRIFQQTHLYPLLRMQARAEEIFVTLRCTDGSELPVLLNVSRDETAAGALYRYAGIVVRQRQRFEAELIAARKTAEKALSENTALVAAKEELRRHTEELDRQIHIATRSSSELQQFNRVVTHDVQEPLRKLSVFSNLLL
jgi:phosphoserine phosphatase RsbU/P